MAPFFSVSFILYFKLDCLLMVEDRLNWKIGVFVVVGTRKIFESGR